MTILASPWSQTVMGGHEIYNLGRGLPGLHNFAFSFSFSCAERGRFLYITYINTI